MPTHTWPAPGHLLRRLRLLTTGLRALALCLLLGASAAASANEATIRANLAERLPNLPRIDEVRPTPMRGLFEVRVSQNQIFYTDAEGAFILQGQLIDTRSRNNLTEQRVEQLNASAFDQLPLRDSFTIVRGNGQRRLAVFQDPNCGFCKRLERDLSRLNHVTIHIFLYPILGRDSLDKSERIWCARNRAQVWENWMLRNVEPAAANCDTAALQRNLTFGQRHQITGTPTTFFADGTRLSGAAGFELLEQRLVAAAAAAR
ncbi:MAG: DsbC family protein [Polaromonas sp.]|nr:DsbC family protein [Polaromonas sp.]